MAADACGVGNELSGSRGKEHSSAPLSWAQPEKGEDLPGDAGVDPCPEGSQVAAAGAESRAPCPV